MNFKKAAVLRIIFLLVIFGLIFFAGRNPNVFGADEKRKTTYQINFKDLNGKEIKLSELKGKVIFLNIWATWCPPCVREMPSIQKLYDSLRDDPNIAFAIVAPKESLAEVKEFILKNKYTFPTYYFLDDPAGEFSLEVYPTTFIIGVDGTIELIVVGSEDYSSPIVREYLRNLHLNKRTE